MKTLFHVILTFLIFAHTADAAEKTNREKDGLIGPVRAIGEESPRVSRSTLRPNVKAHSPDPCDGASGITNPLIKWKPGDTAKWHDVYFGTNRLLGIADFKGQQASTMSAYLHRSGFTPGTTYYWRVDEVEADGTTTYTGDVWSFAAGGKLQAELRVEITLRSEDADWLEYRVHDMKVDPNIHVVFPILSGSLGSGKDDRFHLENGTDEATTDLKANTWHDFSGDVSNYCMVYDNSPEADGTSNTVLAWVRLKESQSVKFKDIGLWNDTNAISASRIRYDIKNATDKDWFSYLLVFSKADKQTVDRWLPAIKAGKMPEANFMTPPSR